MVKGVYSTDEYQDYRAKITFSNVDDVKSLIALIENFQNLKEIQKGLAKFYVDNTLADVEVYEDEELKNEVYCDINYVLVFENSIYFVLLNIHTRDVFEVGSFYTSDLEAIIKEME